MGQGRPGPRFEPIAELRVDPSTALVYELGWQTCSPSLAYRVTDRPFRPIDARNQLIGFRPGHEAPADAFQGEGLLAVQAAGGEPVEVFGVAEAGSSVPSIRARLVEDRLVVSADGPLERMRSEAGVSEERAPDPWLAGRDVQQVVFDPALAAWADRFAARAGVRAAAARPPSIWCSWYRYFDAVTEADVAADLEAIDRLGLPVEVIQVDDGWQRCVGDWSPSERFGSLRRIVASVRESGRRAGIWLAPFLVRASSDVARDHPERLVAGDDGRPLWLGRNWDDDLYALDATCPEAWGPVLDALRDLRELGVDFFKLDFLYAGAVEGGRMDDLPAVVAYRVALASIRDVLGPNAYVLGAGPLLPSVASVDAFRVAPDIAVHPEPDGGDMSQPSVRTAMLTGRGRAFLHGRLFANDPDCLIARPSFGERGRWLDHLRRWGGLRGTSDRIDELDGWGLAATREWLASMPPTRLVEGADPAVARPIPDPSGRV